MHNNAEFLNAYETDKREMRFHLRKRVVTLARKNLQKSYRNIHLIRTLVLMSIIGTQVFKGEINYGQEPYSQNNAHVKISCKSL